MCAFEHRALKIVATGAVAVALFTASVMSVMATPSHMMMVRTKAAVHAQTVKKAPAAKKDIGVKRSVGSKAAIVAKRSIGVRKLAESPTVLEDIVIDNTRVEKVADATSAFRKHFYRGQA